MLPSGQLRLAACMALQSTAAWPHLPPRPAPPLCCHPLPADLDCYSIEFKDATADLVLDR